MIDSEVRPAAAMGNKMCRGDPFVGVQKTLAEIRAVMACDGGDDDQGDAEMMMGSSQPYTPAQKDLSYTGLPGTPVNGAATANTQRQSLPGESVVVTYDVMGQSNRLTPPGESMVVTSPFGASGTPRSGSMGLVTAEKTLTSLEPTKSFDVQAPYKVGDKVEIWSQSNNVWCLGTVQKYQGEYVQISYKSPSGQMISKVMPNGHEHLRFHGHYHGAGNSNSAPGGATPAGSSYQQRPALSTEQRMPSYGSPKPTSPPREIAPGINSPVAANGAYRVGDKIQIFSTSQNTWVDGSVSKSDGEWITISYKGPGGQAMTKIMPNGHEHVRASQGQLYGSTLPEMTPTLLTDSVDSRPPPPTQVYKVGDYVEIFSTSQSTWCKGQISKVDGDYVHVAYRGTKGEPMNKIMPNGHAQLRLLRS